MLAALADPILPVFAICALGYVGGRLSWISGDEARVLNRIAMSVLMPIFIFRAMALAPWDSFDALPILGYLVVQLVFYSTAYIAIRRLTSLGPSESLLLAFCGVFANNAYYSLPIAQFLFGPEATLPLTSIIMLDAVLSFGGSMIALEAMAGRQAGARIGHVIGQILRLPFVWALAAGIVYGVLGLPLTGSLYTFTSFAGSAASPVALLALGVIVAGTSLRPEPVAWAMTGVKTLLFPAAIWGMILLIGPERGDPLFVFAAAGPTGAMAGALALLYGVRPTAIMQVTILTSLFTLGTLALLA